MCGIGGWYCWGDARPTVGHVQALLLANRLRGTDAAGVAFQEGTSIRIKKHQGPAEHLISTIGRDSGLWDKIVSSPRGLVHARQATKGEAKDNRNNHPVERGGWVVVHNGQITNDDDLWDYYDKDHRSAEVDTSAVPLVLSQGTDYDTALTYLSILQGSATLAIWNANSRDRIALARLDGADVFLFLDPKKEILYWSSAAVAGRRLPSVPIANIRFLTMTRVPNNHILVLEPNEQLARAWKVTRSPFFHPRTHTRGVGRQHRILNDGGSVSKTGAPTRTPLRSCAVSTTLITETGPSESEAKRVNKYSDGVTYSEEAWDITWRPVSHKRDPSKPLPEFDRHRMDWRNCDPDRYNNLLENGSDGMQLRVPTPYGHWNFRRMAQHNGGVYRYSFFRPHKRVKKWWHRNFNSVRLPAAQREDGTTSLDHKLPYEWLLLTMPLPSNFVGTTNAYKSGGYLCPWCGAWARLATWNAWILRCAFCNIKSDIPRDVVTTP